MQSMRVYIIYIFDKDRDRQTERKTDRQTDRHRESGDGKADPHNAR